MLTEYESSGAYSIDHGHLAYDRSMVASSHELLRQSVRQHFGNVIVPQLSVCAPPATLDRWGSASLRTLSLAKISFAFLLIFF